MKLDKYRTLFIKEAKEYLKEIYSHLELLNEIFDKERVIEMERLFHSIKGMASTMGYKEIAETAHRVEGLLKDVLTKEEITLEIYEEIISASDNIMQFISQLEKEGEVKSGREEKKKKNVFSIKIQADVADTLPGPRYFVIYKTLSKAGEIRNMNLAPDDFKKGYRGTFEFIYETEKYEKEDLVKLLENEPDLKWFHVEEIAEEREKERGVLSVREDVVEELFSELVRVGERITRIQYISNVKGLNEIGYEANSLAVQFKGVFSKFISLRMVSLSDVFVHVPAVVRSTASSIGKKVELEFEGGDIVVDKYVASMLSDPVLHILRNAVDHGIEPPEERVKIGKPEKGKIRFICEEKAGNIVITIEDDGSGIDREKIKATALSKGLITEDKLNTLSIDEIYSLITLPGFSTKAEATYVSGRGVGMDVVKSVVERLGGSMKIESEEGSFTRIVLSFPVSVSLTDVFMFEVEGYIFGTFPSFIEKVCSPEEYEKEYNSVIFNEKLYPVYRFSPFEGMKKVERGDVGSLVLCGRNEVCFAISVDEVKGVAHMFLNLVGYPLNMLPGVIGTCIDEVGNLCIVINPFELRRAL